MNAPARAPTVTAHPLGGIVVEIPGLRLVSEANSRGHTVCAMDCTIVPDLGMTPDGLPYGHTVECDACGAPDAAPLDLDAIEARARTPEPFAFNMKLPSCDHPERGHAPQCHNCRRADLEREIATRKPTFAMHGRQDVLALVAEVRRLRQRNEELVIERDECAALAREHNDKRYAVLHRLRECTDPSGTGCVDCDAAPTCIDGDGALRCDDHRSQPRDGLDFNRDSQET